jgi:hypothetical protein
MPLLMLALTVALAVAAAPPPDLKLAAPGLTTSGVDPSLAGPLTDHLARAFVGVRVITPRDIGALLGLERQRELLGCTEQSTECMAELGNALGVQGVLLGDVVKLGGAVQITVRIIDPSNGRELASAAERVDSDSEIFDALTRAGTQARAQFLAALKVSLPGALPPPSRGVRRFSPIPLAAGAAFIITGGILLGVSEGTYQRLTSGPPMSILAADAAGIAQSGSTFQTSGWVLASIGIGVALAGLALLLFGGP